MSYVDPLTGKADHPEWKLDCEPSTCTQGYYKDNIYIYYADAYISAWSCARLCCGRYDGDIKIIEDPVGWMG